MPNAGQNSQGARSSAPFLILAWAGVAGAAGVALAAVAAHKVESPALATAAMMLTIHAAAAVGIIALAMRTEREKLWQAAAVLMLAAASLFSGDIALHTLSGTHVFPMAAPTGGSLLIASWLIVAGLAIAAWLTRS
ncbi:MAG TPA: DUF423 domain-containing protein [Hyphomicrobium sp.]|uniref:DUF423 domain-containing protein n=1 Tax=Hyphomicrobium sp. TaxID=82 RepID=UPI002C1D0284|nr:DUF423 domain-containing protein [Hyphomicrobium sp.]HXE02236.1 DUF423 domain-containing protein [Hyphomicrobium sp.]